MYIYKYIYSWRELEKYIYKIHVHTFLMFVYCYILKGVYVKV